MGFHGGLPVHMFGFPPCLTSFLSFCRPLCLAVLACVFLFVCPAVCSSSYIHVCSLHLFVLSLSTSFMYRETCGLTSCM